MTIRNARIGVDLGGTKIESVVMNSTGTILARERIATPRDYEQTVRAIRDLVLKLEALGSVSATVGVGIPGTISTESGVVKNANSVWLNGRALKDDLERELERPIRIMNDANCFAISEAADGAGRGAASVFGVILGTGVGGGIVIRGHPLDGANLIAGEWGHNPLPWMTADEYPGSACYCGRMGCIETFLCGPRFEQTYATRVGGTASASDIVRAAESGNAIAAAHVATYENRLTRALAAVVNIVDPDVIVLGGGMSNIASLPAAVTTLLSNFVFSDSVRTRVVRNIHGDSSGVRGAAWLWPANTIA